jgi:hypothetical protein
MEAIIFFLKVKRSTFVWSTSLGMLCRVCIRFL